MLSTVRIIGSPNEGDVGTGFVFAYESDPVDEGNAAFFLVTNRHVVENADKGSVVFIEKNPDGKPALGRGIEVRIPAFEHHWHYHPDNEVDIAVMYIQPLIDERQDVDGPTFGESTVVTPIRSAHVAKAEHLETLDALEEVYFIGYPAGLYDSVNLTPILRRGTTATPVDLDYEGRPVFLIDAAVFSGSSGSPVFAASNSFRTDAEGNFTLIGSRMLFLGVIAEYLNIEEQGEVEWKPIPTEGKAPTYVFSQALNLGVVYKASTVVETIEDWIQKYSTD